MAIWRALPRFRGECSERTFVFRIAHNRAIAYITRRQLPTRGCGDELEIEDAPAESRGNALSRAGRTTAAGRDPASPGEPRQVVTLMLEGFSYSEIAEVLGITETNVGARLTRARQMLRRAALRDDDAGDRISSSKRWQRAMARAGDCAAGPRQIGRGRHTEHAARRHRRDHRHDRHGRRHARLGHHLAPPRRRSCWPSPSGSSSPPPGWPPTLLRRGAWQPVDGHDSCVRGDLDPPLPAKSAGDLDPGCACMSLILDVRSGVALLLSSASRTSASC